MRGLMFAAAILSATLLGCSSNPGMVPDPVPVTGTVTFANGKPVSNVVLNLQPMERGYGAMSKLGADGKFKADMVPGKYMYYFSAAEAKSAVERQKNETAFKTIPGKYHNGDLETYVRVGSAAVDIKLD